ncbi:MAG: RNA polymerase subunit sigma-24, partial [Streptomyces sp.]
RTITSAGKVGRFLFAVAEQSADLGFVLLELNGSPAVLATRDGAAQAVLQLDVADGRIQCVYAITNPDKVAHLRP